MPKILRSLLIILALYCPAWATTYYVDTAGTDNGSCGTSSGASACAHLSYLVATRGLGGAGDTIQVAAGSYTDNTAMSVPVDVTITGAGSATTTITTSASGYAKMQTSVPTVNGANEVSGINFIASSTNTGAILSTGRNNQKIHDNIFTNWTNNSAAYGRGLTVQGKHGPDDSGGGYWNGSCSGGEASCTWCDNNKALNVLPSSTDWATGIQIYNNTFNNSGLMIDVLKGALIHDNTFNNDTGTNVSGIGNTGYFFSGVQIYNNTLKMNSMTYSIIAVELWAVQEDVKFYNNNVSGWTSWLGGGLGKGSTSYTLEVYDNNYYVSKAMTGFMAVEVTELISDVSVRYNYFASSATDRGFSNYVTLTGSKATSNIQINNNVFGLIWSGGNAVAVDIEDTDATSNHTNTYVYNNTFDMGPTGTSAVLIYQNSTGLVTNTYVRNNIVNSMRDNFVITASSDWTGNTAQYNYTYNTTNDLRAPGVATWTASNNVFTAVTPPGFVGSGNKPAPYYTLALGAPTIDVGANLGTTYDRGLAPSSTWPSSVTTLNQNSYGTGWEMGAFVYGLNGQPAAPTALTVTVY